MDALNATAVRLEDAGLELGERGQGGLQRLFGQRIEQILERLVGIGVDGVWLFSDGDGAEQRQGDEGQVEEGAHGGGMGCRV